MAAELTLARSRVRITNECVVAGAPVIEVQTGYKRPPNDFQFYGGARELREAVLGGAPEVMVHGPAECLAGESRILNPVTGDSPSIAELAAQNRKPLVLTLFGQEEAEVPFIKGSAPLYKVTTNTGKSCLVSGKHLFLTRRGWVFCEDLSSDDWLLSSNVSPLQSTLESSLLKCLPSARRYLDRDLNCQGGCSAYPHPCGVQLRDHQVSSPTSAPSRTYARGHSRESPQGDGQACLIGHNRHHQLQHLPSNLDSSHLFGLRAGKGFGSSSKIAQRMSLSSLCVCQSPQKIHPQQPTASPQVYFGSMPHFENLIDERLAFSSSGRHAEYLSLKAPPSFLYGESVDMLPELLHAVLELGVVYPFSSSKRHYTVEWTKVSSIKYVRDDVFYDMHVPKAGHYFAEGLWHHNTGKTSAALQILDELCWTNPGCQGAMVRKVANDLWSSIVHDYKTDVLKLEPGQFTSSYGVRSYGGEKPEFFQYPNGSKIWVCGLDRPGKVLSTQKDFIYINQAEELEKDDWETCSSRTTGRGKVLQPGRLIGDCNPGPATHWILGRAEAGSLKMIKSNHKDNPTLFDPQTGEITAQGKRSMHNLNNLTGVLYKRYKGGLWVAAEGVVYEEFDATIHVVDRPFAPIRYYIAGVDWGLKNPGVIQVWGVDGDDRMYRVKEIYQTGRLVAASKPEDAWWINKAKEVLAEFDIRTFVCDPSRPDHMEAFELEQIPCEPAYNSVELGIQNVQSRLKIQEDRVPRLMIIRGSRDPDKDPTLTDTFRPTCLEDEFGLYAWPKDAKGKPVKENPVEKHNHACDAMRYAAAAVDSLGTNEFLSA